MKLNDTPKKVSFNETITVHTYKLSKYHNYIKDRGKKKLINRYLRKIERKLRKKNIISENEYFDYKIISTK